jgi:hypothetical protein
MVERCLLCGKTDPGKPYSFHYGKIASTDSEHYANISETITRFNSIHKKQAVICKKCVHAHVRHHALVWGAVGVAAAILPAAFCRFLSLLEIPTQAQGVACFLASIALLVIFLGLSVVFSNVWMCLTGRCSDYAEKMAIDALRAELEEKEHANVFWTSRQFARLRPIPKS